MRRKWQAELSVDVKSGHALTSLECEGRQTSDHTLWKQEIKKHCIQKYHDPLITDQFIRERLDNVRQLGNNLRLDGQSPPPLTFDIVMRARSRLADGKSPGGRSPVVADMLKELPFAFCYLVHHLFFAETSGVLF